MKHIFKYGKLLLKVYEIADKYNMRVLLKGLVWGLIIGFGVNGIYLTFRYREQIIPNDQIKPRTIEKFANYLKANPRMSQNLSKVNIDISKQSIDNKMTTNINENHFFKVSGLAMNKMQDIGDTKLMNAIQAAGKHNTQRSEQIYSFVKIIKSDSQSLNTSDEDRGLAINYLREQLVSDPALVDDFIDVAFQLSNDPESKMEKSTIVNEMLSAVPPQSANAERVIELLAPEEISLLGATGNPTVVRSSKYFLQKVGLGSQSRTPSAQTNSSNNIYDSNPDEQDLNLNQN